MKREMMKERLLLYINITRINKLSGMYLLLIPCFFGICNYINQNRVIIKSSAEIQHKLILITIISIVGSLLMRSAGCIINDFFDRDFDKKVARTKNRPLASGRISVRECIFLLLFLLSLSLLLLLQLNLKAILLGFASLLLVIIYPLMKRVTYYPQIFLGVVFNMGVIITNVYLFDHIDFGIINIYFASIIWTFIYDTIYAYQDVEDDIKIGVKSTAIKFKQRAKPILIKLVLVKLFFLYVAGFILSYDMIFYVINLLNSFMLIFLIYKNDFKDSLRCYNLFQTNILVGCVIAFSILIS